MGQSFQKKEIKSAEGSLNDRANRKKYQELLEKAEKLFQKEKFGSARHHFGEAYQIYPFEEVQKRIQACEENAKRVVQAQDLVKQGYQLEREKNLKEALKVFQLSLNAWENKEVQTLVAKLQSKLPKPTLIPGHQAEADHRYAEAIERYGEVLELEENSEAKERMGICLVKQGAYAEAVRLLKPSPSQDPEVLYYTGYALARLRRYSEALRRWEMMGQDTPELAIHKQKLLEIATRDLIHRSRLEGEFDQAWQEAVNLLISHPALPSVRNCVRSMCLYHLEELWLQEKFKAMLDFCATLQPLPMQDKEKRGDFLPFILAKVYYRLSAINAAEYLPDAITFWLTVIHNPTYMIPSALREEEGLSAQASQDQLTRDLQQKLEQLVQTFKTNLEGHSPPRAEIPSRLDIPSRPSQGREESGQENQRKEASGQGEAVSSDQGEAGRLKEILTHWEMERKSIDFLYEIVHQEITHKGIPQQETARQEETQQETARQDSNQGLADLLCTPAFAERFGLSSSILERLQGVQSLWENDERFWIVGALFSGARRSFLLLNQGKLDEALAALPARKEDLFADYCRQRIFFRLGMERLQRGETNLKKYFSQAAPLIQRFKEYEKEIIQLAQGIGNNLQKLISMDEVLQILIRQIKSGELLEITSYIMSYKAHGMYADGLIKALDVERICKKALELYPGNEFASNSLQEIQSRYVMEELQGALNKGNMKKAASITINAGNDEIEEAFFEFIDFALEELDNAPLDRDRKILFLRDLYHNCERVDSSHPILDDITDEIEILEGEV
jgi:tetratricopeptide (TPR) repeat protein